MTDTILITELSGLRKQLNPLLTEHFKKVLLEAERRLSKDVSTSLGKPFKRRRITTKPTRKELYDKFNSRGL